MAKFHDLFQGRGDCYGRYFVLEERPDGKRKGRGQTVHEPLTGEVYDQHLSGQIRLGVVPIRTDGTVSWFAGDIDKYGLDIVALDKKAQAAEIPVVVCRSKSGGAHLYCFVRGEPAPASLVIPVMREWLKALGFESWVEGVRRRTPEVFPKQSHVTEETTGNWINLPYHNAADPDAYAIGLNGEKLDLADFLSLAKARSVTLADLKAVKIGKKEQKANGKSPLEEAPPCVETMFRDGIGEGGRNNAMTHIGIYYFKSDPDNYYEKMMEANYRVLDPPLPAEEVKQIARNVSKGKYQYLCQADPMCSLCDRETCMTRKWGVGPQQGIDYSGVEIDRIRKICSDPPIYYVVINGHSVKMTSDQLLTPSRFRRRIYEVTGMLIAPMKERQHEARIQSVKTEVEAAPREVSEEGAIIEAFEEWCETHIATSKSLSEVRRGSPYYDREGRRVVFRATDLIAALKRKNMFNIPDRDVWAALRNQGCARENVRIESEQTKVWVFPVEKPWFNMPTEEAF